MGDGGLEVGQREGCLVLTLAGGSANALSPNLRAALIAALAAADAKRVVVTATGAGFSSALPSDDDLTEPSLARLCAAVEQAPVPVLVALHGLVIGPGAELALAAAARLAAPDTRIAFPEIALGLCPSGGTTLRLPRRIGAGPALSLLLSGRAVPVGDALALGLIDAISDDPLAAACAAPLPDAPARPASEVLAAVQKVRRGPLGALPAGPRIVECVEAAALLPAEAHQAFERVAREDLSATTEAEGLRAAVRAERRASVLPPAIARLRPAPVARVALHGEVPSLVALACAALAKGLHVDWIHRSAAGRAASLAALDLAEAAEQRAGRLTAAARAAGRARLVDGVGGRSEALVHIHAPVQGPLPGRMDDGIAHLVLEGAEGELGLSLCPSGRACELSVLAEETPEAIAIAVATLRRIGLGPVLVGQRPVLGRRVMAAGETALAHLARSGVPQRILTEALGGFGARMPAGLPPAEAPLRAMTADEVLARWLAALANEALRLLDQGIARRPSDIDHLLVAGHGFPRWRGGPMHQADRRGLLVLRHDLRRWAGEHPVWAPAPLVDRLVRDGLRLSVLDG